MPNFIIAKDIYGDDYCFNLEAVVIKRSGSNPDIVSVWVGSGILRQFNGCEAQQIWDSAVEMVAQKEQP